MSVPLYIGDPNTASALRLAGVRIFVPDDEDPVELFQKALTQTGFLLLGSTFARGLPEALLRDAQQKGHPLVTVIPDVLGEEAFTGQAWSLRRQLGWGQAR